MTEPISVPFPRQYDLQGGACLTATVARLPDGNIAIVVDARDASSIELALWAIHLDNRDDQEAAEKLAELIDAAVCGEKPL